MLRSKSLLTWTNEIQKSGNYPPIWFFQYVFQILTERPESQLPWNLINISITQMTTSKIVVSCLTSKLSTVSKPVIFLAYFMLMIKPHH